jgi:hypothetical protein
MKTKYSVRWTNLANGHEEVCTVGSDLCDALLLLSEQTANPILRSARIERFNVVEQLKVARGRHDNE